MTGFSRTSRGVDSARRAAAVLVLLAGLAVPPAALAVPLPAAPASDSVVEPAAVGIAAVTTITGTVRDANRTGIAGMWVSVAPEYGQGQYTGTSSGADGSFSLTAGDGVYIVNFFPPSETNFVNGYYLSSARSLWTDNYGSATRITVSGGTLALGTITVPRGARIRGRVTTSDGTGIGNVQVSGNNLTYTRSVWTLTDANGDFTTNALLADQFRLEVRPQQGSPYVAGWYAQGATGNWAATQELATSVTVATVDITLGTVVPVTGARLSGRITDATSGLGVPYAQVQIQPVGPGPWAGITADSTGDFITGALLPGSFKIRVSPAPWLPSDLVAGYYRADPPGNYAPTASGATTITLGGSDVPGIDVALPTGRRISGNVVGQDGLPIQGMDWGTSVAVCPPNSWDCARTGFGQNGDFSVTVLEGPYTIQIDTNSPDLLSGYYATSAPGQWARNLSGASVVTAGATEVSVGTIVLPRGWAIAGTVRDTSGALLAGAFVSACPATGDGSGCGWAQTSATGTYRTSAVASGSFVVSVSPPAGGTQIGGAYRTGVSGNWTADLFSATPVVVSATDATGIDVTLPVGRRISGTITTNLGVGLAGAFVIACPASGSGQCGSAQTAANGSYATGGLLPGQYRVEVQAPSTSAQVSGTYRVDATTGNWTQDRLNGTSITVGSTADVTGINVRLPAGLRIRGLIKDAGGAPVQNAFVTICGIGTWSCPAFGSSATGEFASGGLLPGSYLVSVRAPDGTDLLGGYYASSSELTPDRDLATPLTLSSTDGSTGVLVLTPGLTVSGSISDGSKPVSGAWVQLCPLRGDCVRGVTDFAGSYRTNAVPPGRYRVTVQAPWRSNLVSGAYDPTVPGGVGDYPGRSLDVTDGTEALDFTLATGIRPFGTVRDPAGQPVAGAYVSIGTASPGSYRGTGGQSGADGAFTADSAVPEGSYRFFVTPPEGTRLASGSGLVVETLANPVDLTLGTGWLVSGRITGPDGAGVAGAWVSVFGGSGGSAWARTDGAGDFTTTSGLATGTDYLISVEPPQDSSLVGGRYSATAPGGYTPDWDGATPISLTSGDATGIAVRLPLGSAIAGRILGANGEAVPGARVFACSPGTCRGALTSATGAFRTGALADGAIEVYVYPPEGSSYIGGYLGSDPATRFTTRWSERATLTLKGADVTGVTIRIGTGARIGGTLVGTDDQPVPDVGVSVFSASEGSYASYAITTSLGTFRTGGVATDGTYLVKIGWDDPASPYASGWYSSSSEDGYFTPFMSQASGLAVGSTDASTGVVRVPRGHRISGKVSFADGSSPRWVQATLGPADASCGETAAIWPLQTDEAGAFFFTGIPDGSYRIRLYGGYYGANGAFELTPGDAIVVSGGDLQLGPLALPEGTTSDATPAGDCVKVTPTDASSGSSPASITFETIDGEGTTTLRAVDSSATAAVYEIDTTAEYTGDTLVCISYDGLELPEGTAPRLYHENSDGTWVDITVSVDLVGHFVCGYTTSFSPFAVSTKAAPLAIELGGSGAGTVRIGGSRTCTASCTLDLTFGTTVTLTAEASAGSRFLGWSGACTNTSGECTIELLGRRTLTARFSRPTVGTMTPATGGVGQSVSVSGGDLAGVTRVEFNGVPALFTALSNSRFVTSVPAGATTGKIRAFIGDFSTVTAANFSVGTKAVAPTITALRPAAVRTGMRVTVTGTNLVGVKSATVNGIAVLTTGDGLVRVDATTLTFVVPAGASSGVVRVTTDGGTSSGSLALAILPPPVKVAGGGSHSCAALADGTARCWGANGSGQLGNGGTTSSVNPVVVTGLAGVIAVGAGSSHTCALLTSATVRCWGANTNGQIGDGSTSVRKTAVVVRTSAASAVALPNVTAIAAGASHTCALIVDGSVRCWGLNSSGQLGDGTTVQRTSPVTVTDGSGPLSGVTSIAAGGNTTCAIVASGAVRCWGANESGQLGTSSTTGSTRPTSVTDGTTGAPLTGVTRLAVGGTPAVPGAVTRTHVCAVIGATSSVRCWGSNLSGQLGIGTSGGIRTSMVAVSDGSGGELTGATSVSAGGEHTCVVVSSGAGASIRCWGLNANGQLGDGTQTSRAFPTLVTASSDPWSTAGTFSLACGSGHTLAISASDLYAPQAAATWGSNASGQLGLPLTTARMTRPTLLRTL